MEGGEEAAGETAERRERGMEGGEEAAGKTLDAGSEAWREERGGSRKPLDAGSEAWREESRQRGNRWMLWGREARRSSEPVLGMDCHMVVYE